jgi:hypothetical protein
MHEVHAPHQSMHTWKDFLLHIAAIALGLSWPSVSNKWWSTFIIGTNPRS